jgi:serine O-acetyltransferase
MILEILSEDPSISIAACEDLLAIRENDPATDNLLVPFLFMKGFACLSLHRISHWLWHQGRQAMATALQQHMSGAAAVDIHPAAMIGHGILLDHATGLVIGETAVVGDSAILFHNVTLGGTGKQRGDRHPKLGQHVFVGAGAKVLGNVKIGDFSRIGAGSVVLDDVPPHHIAVGVPARCIPTNHQGWHLPAVSANSA